MRALTRPEGSEAVDSVQVSGCAMAGERGVADAVDVWSAVEGVVCATANHLWNWTMGEMSRSRRCSVERRNWSAGTAAETGQ